MRGISVLFIDQPREYSLPPSKSKRFENELPAGDTGMSRGASGASSIILYFINLNGFTFILLITQCSVASSLSPHAPSSSTLRSPTATSFSAMSMSQIWPKSEVTSLNTEPVRNIHLKHIAGYMEEGTFVLGGAFADASGAALLFKTSTEDAVYHFVKNVSSVAHSSRTLITNKS